MRTIGSKFLGLLLFVASVGGASFGQNVTGSISGTVSDSKGGVVPNVTVTVTNADQKVAVRTLTTDDRGQYVAALLPVGRYNVTVEAAGFKKATRSGIVLNVDDRLAVNFILEVGSVNESVSVEADALHVDTESATASGVISGLQLRELSLNSRNYAQLVTLGPWRFRFRQRRPDFPWRHGPHRHQRHDLPNQRQPPRGKQLASGRG